MRKLLSLVVAGGLLAASASMASAVDIKVKGQLNFGFGLYDGRGFTKHDDEENFDAKQRLRTQVDFIASESLKGVARFEIGETPWGANGGATWGGDDAGRGTGGAMGADGVSVEVKWLYLDWLVPETDLQVRMGIQPFANPQAVYRANGNDGSAVIDDDVAGLLLSYNFNENVGINLGWFRPWDGSTNIGGPRNNTDPRFGDNDEIDFFFLSLPIEVKDSFSLTPWGIFALVGDNFNGNTGQNNSYLYGTAPGWMTGHGQFTDDGKAWWLGAAFELSAFDPFIAALDFTYGSYTADDYMGDSNDRDGWSVVAKLGYKLDYFTPAIFGWYGSGARKFDERGTFDGLLPVMSPCWGPTSFGFAGSNPTDTEGIIGGSPAGTWAVGLALEDIRFVDKLTSHLRVAYFRGTSDANDYNKAARKAGTVDAFREYGILDKRDWGMEVNLDNVINVYENLDMFVDLAYVRMNVKEHTSDFNKNAWRGFVGFQYNF